MIDCEKSISRVCIGVYEDIVDIFDILNKSNYLCVR